MRTFSIKSADVVRKWYVIDASQAPLGRISTVAASLLIGKGKPTFTPHVDGGDFVVIINAAKLVVTGNKLAGKIYSNHSGYPSGLRQRTLGDMIQSKPEEVIEKAVRGMLPVNKLRAGRLVRLKVYADDNHPHAPQQPEVLQLGKAK